VQGKYTYPGLSCGVGTAESEFAMSMISIPSVLTIISGTIWSVSSTDEKWACRVAVSRPAILVGVGGSKVLCGTAADEAYNEICEPSCWRLFNSPFPKPLFCPARVRTLVPIVQKPGFPGVVAGSVDYELRVGLRSELTVVMVPSSVTKAQRLISHGSNNIISLESMLNQLGSGSVDAPRSSLFMMQYIRNALYPSRGEGGSTTRIGYTHLASSFLLKEACQSPNSRLQSQFLEDSLFFCINGCDF
jgi:hypothetical protein